MALTIAFLLLGFGLLLYGANLLVKGAINLALWLEVSNFIIGLTVVAFGTSLPELTVNTFNSFRELNDAVFGNIIGSNIFNILLILGVAGLIFPINLSKRSVAYEIPFSMLVTLILFGLVNDRYWGWGTSMLEKIDALFLLLLFSLFLVHVLRNSRSAEIPKQNSVLPFYQFSLYILGGLIMMVLGGYLATKNAVSLAEYFGMSEKLIALTILSSGTSLPELMTSAVASYRRNADIAMGNVIGSNIFNITFILGISGVIHPVRYDVLLNRDISVLIWGSVLLILFMFTGVKMKLDRWEAALLLGLYVLYIIYIIQRN